MAFLSCLYQNKYAEESLVSYLQPSVTDFPLAAVRYVAGWSTLSSPRHSGEKKTPRNNCGKASINKKKTSIVFAGQTWYWKLILNQTSLTCSKHKNYPQEFELHCFKINRINQEKTAAVLLHQKVLHIQLSPPLSVLSGGFFSVDTLNHQVDRR